MIRFVGHPGSPIFFCPVWDMEGDWKQTGDWRGEGLHPFEFLKNNYSWWGAMLDNANKKLFQTDYSYLRK